MAIRMVTHGQLTARLAADLGVMASTDGSESQSSTERRAEEFASARGAAELIRIYNQLCL
jgi:hypothetical protein